MKFPAARAGGSSVWSAPLFSRPPVFHSLADKATIGYRALSEAVGTPEKSLIRMFGAKGNPRASHLSRVIEALQRHENVRLKVSAGHCADAA